MKIKKPSGIFRNKQENKQEMVSVKNIIILGETGSGKSSLANTIIDKNGHFEEGSGLSTGTKEFNFYEFEENNNNINYRIIDTVGFNEIKNDSEQILKKLMKIHHFLKNDGLNQIILVINSRFTENVFNTYKLLEEVVFFDRSYTIREHTTIVRTNFDNFDDEKSCKEDIQKFLDELFEKNEEMAKFIKYLAEKDKIVYLDNPSLNVKNIIKKNLNSSTRTESRRKILSHFSNNQGIFFPDCNELSRVFDNFSLLSDQINNNFSSTYEHFNDYYEKLESFFVNRYEVILNIEENQGELKNNMTNRFYQNTASNSVMLIGKGVAISGLFFPPLLLPGAAIAYVGLASSSLTDSSSVYKEWKVHEDFLERIENDKNLYQNIKKLESITNEKITNFFSLYAEFNKSKYCKLRINQEKINYFENLNNWLAERQINNKSIQEESNIDVLHDSKVKILRTGVETIIKLIPSPYTFWAILRDKKEINERESLKDFENLIKNYKINLENLKIHIKSCYKILKEWEQFNLEIKENNSYLEENFIEQSAFNLIIEARESSGFIN